MNRSQAAARIRELKDAINEHNRKYYVLNTPDISDFEFDLLLQELTVLEKKYPDLAGDDSPTRHVGSDIAPENNAFLQFPHRYPMLSLSNTYNKEELLDFHNRISKVSDQPVEYVCELKLDGTAICLTYKDGRLFRALTRGDGTIGDDVTRNVLRIKSIPERLTPAGDFPYPPEFEIRGEIVMPFISFGELNSAKEKNGEPLFANPRNAAAGTLKLLSADEVERRGLDCYLYHLIADVPGIKTHWQALETASQWGFPVSQHRRLCRNVEEIMEFLEYWDKARADLPIATDGVVVKVNSFSLQKTLGMTAKSPRWATAYKFKAEQAATRLLSVDFQVGRTGAITPVANLEPVLLSGTTVKRASLHNADQIALHDIRLGDMVYVEKGGEIIPKVIGVELSSRPGNAQPFHYITHCPECGSLLERDPGEAKHFCPNRWECPPQIKGRIEHFMSRKAMNILGGEALVEQLYDKQIVKDPADLYYLEPPMLEALENWGDKSTQNLLSSIEASKKVPFHRFLFALGIPFVGETTAKYLASHFGSLQALKDAPIEDLTEAPEIGIKIASSIRDFFENPVIGIMLDKLKDAGLPLRQDVTEKELMSESLQGLQFVISGTFSRSREDMKNLVQLHGGKVLSGVSAHVDYLLSGDKTGPSKLQKASAMGIRIIGEKDFLALIGELPSEGTLFENENKTTSF
ncbi:MAG TPA: NAD-dependent DNA ligase LigA [Bacteroidales bacterium]|jgi:DNA ligase (NAD+)|nr:NAD-dependent DNA ligase LigA [Bacteroidales bacterium]HPA42440.1 NAD-dependent DNA ligase LigA [Bacteroidales bacterium]HQM97867.1 NAD-dependent DNA ligase LigA [Bacteroidales bacterium]HQQ80211.1 NAD-dependent DNA ligase LigA [Bacteroidales bacterium]